MCGKRLILVALGSAIGAVALLFSSAPAVATVAVPTALPAMPGVEQEPNGSAVTANPIASGERVRASLDPGDDVDYYRFVASAGDHVFAATMTNAFGSSDGETQLTLLRALDSKVIETDYDSGSFGPHASSIAGAETPTSGAYLLKINHAWANGELPAYDLYLRLQSGQPVEEVEPNDTMATANSPAGRYISGIHASPGDRDFYAMQLHAGDTVFLSLDADPERDEQSFHARLGFGPLNDPNYTVVVSDLGSTGAAALIPSNSYEITVSKDGTYYALVSALDPTEGSAAATYRLSATVLPATLPRCHTYTIMPSPGTIPDGGAASFTIPVPDFGTVERAAIALDLTHTLPTDLSTSLRAPSGYEVPLFSGAGISSATHMVASFDPYAAVAPTFILRPVMLQPELSDPRAWLSGQEAQGSWSLVIRDDRLDETGSLARADLILCGPPDSEPLPTNSPTDVAPVLASLNITPKRFRAAISTAIASAGKARAPVGTTISYADSQAAVARLDMFRLVPGRKVGGGCVPVRRANRNKPFCARESLVGGIAHSDVAGENVVRFNGRVDGRKPPLSPGKYVLKVTATSASGKSSNTLAGRFRVAPGRKPLLGGM
jgi:subtilisin-like proprotein convertase family protein